MQLQAAKAFSENLQAIGCISSVKDDTNQNNKMGCQWVHDKNSNLYCK